MRARQMQLIPPPEATQTKKPEPAADGLTWDDLPDLTEIGAPRAQYEHVRVSGLEIYLRWLDEVRELLARHGQQSVEAWQLVPTMPDLAVELNAVADAIEELAGDLRNIGDAVVHASHCTKRQMAPAKGREMSDD